MIESATRMRIDTVRTRSVATASARATDSATGIDPALAVSVRAAASAGGTGTNGTDEAGGEGKREAERRRPVAMVLLRFRCHTGVSRVDDRRR